MSGQRTDHPLFQDPDYTSWTYNDPRTIVLHGGLTLPEWFSDMMGNTKPIEELLNFHFFYLQGSGTRLILLLSMPLDEQAVQYHLSLVADATGASMEEMRSRLSVVVLQDDRPKPFIRKLKDHPEQMLALQNLVPDPHTSMLMALMPCTELDELAVELGIPFYANPPEQRVYDEKSGTRLLCKELGVPVPEGMENLHSMQEVYDAWVSMGSVTGRYALKLNNADSGFGLFLAQLDDSVTSPQELFARLEPPDGDDTQSLEARLAEVGAAFERFIEAAQKQSPSVQFTILPDGSVVERSTHEQHIKGTHFTGCTFPADVEYRSDIVSMVRPVVEQLAQHGVMGNVGADLISVRNKNTEPWQHYIVELNIRVTATSLALQWVQQVLNAAYGDDGLLRQSDGTPIYYFQSTGWGRVLQEQYKEMPVSAFLEKMKQFGLLFTQETKEGVLFEIIGNLRVPRATYLIIASSPERVSELKKHFEQMVLASL